MKFHWEFLPRQDLLRCSECSHAEPWHKDSFSCWEVSKSARTTPARASFLPVGKGSRNLPNIRSGICWTMQCLCSALTFPALIPHYLAPQNSGIWAVLGSRRVAKSQAPRRRWYFCNWALSHFARAPFPGSGGILRTLRTHPAAGCPCSLWPCISSFPEPSPGIPSPWPPFLLPPPSQHFPPHTWLFLKWKVYPGWMSSCLFGNDVQIKPFPSYLYQIIKALSKKFRNLQ